MNIIDKLLCTHGHRIEDHPACFAQGNVDLKKAEKIAKENGIEWYEMPEYKIGILDIEADGLKADFSTMLTWCIKEKSGKINWDMVEQKDLFSGQGDKKIIESLCKELRNYKIVIGYFSTGYDIPYIRTKALHYGIEFPEYGSLYHFDLYYTVKSKLNVSRRSLDSVCDYLGIEGKTPINREVWRLAKYGNEPALLEVLNHNKGDVIITEQLYEKLLPFRKWVKTSV
jgi:uncharacterized protein YprB with RNaseH-like and TPR domain